MVRGLRDERFFGDLVTVRVLSALLSRLGYVHTDTNYAPVWPGFSYATLYVNVVALAVMTRVAEEGNRRKGGMTGAEITQSVIGKIMHVACLRKRDLNSRSCSGSKIEKPRGGNMCRLEKRAGAVGMSLEH